MLYSFCLELLRNTQIVQQLNLTSLIAKPFVLTLYFLLSIFGETETRWAGTSSSRMTASFTIALTVYYPLPLLRQEHLALSVSLFVKQREFLYPSRIMTVFSSRDSSSTSLLPPVLSVSPVVCERFTVFFLIFFL